MCQKCSNISLGLSIGFESPKKKKKKKKAVTVDLKEQSDLALPTALVICQETSDSFFKTEIK